MLAEGALFFGDRGLLILDVLEIETNIDSLANSNVLQASECSERSWDLLSVHIRLLHTTRGLI